MLFISNVKLRCSFQIVGYSIPLIRVCCSDLLNMIRCLIPLIISLLSIYFADQFGLFLARVLLKSFPSLISMTTLVQFRFPFDCFKAGLSTVENIGYCFLIPRLTVFF